MVPADTRALLDQLQRPLDDSRDSLGVVLAAGHGKRIRSATSKMLHEIWGRPTVQRVADAVAKGIDSPNQVIVVGIKGEDVA
ncbi:MAG: NTP transferase domain-containing protein, partial [Gemmatimonadetes bacterium]|nr:NTP transferase domain-containing protein [Gemmatimonadota bacterium]